MRMPPLACLAAGALLVGLLAVPAEATTVEPMTAVAATAVAPASAPAHKPSAINDLARTPYLGWNTYYGLGSTYDYNAIKSVTDSLVSRGLKAAGYQYVWLDGGWWSGTRDDQGNITVD